MATTASRLSEVALTQAIEKRLPGSRVAEMTRVRPNARLGGVVAWSGFSRKSQIERQRLLWDGLREELDDEELLQVGLILTVTPEQLGALDED